MISRRKPTWVERFGADLVARWDAGESQRAIAELLGDMGFSVHQSSVRYWMVKLSNGRQQLGEKVWQVNSARDALDRQVLALMADGVPRTLNDVGVRVAATPYEIRWSLTRLTADGKIAKDKPKPSMPSIWQKVAA